MRASYRAFFASAFAAGLASLGAPACSAILGIEDLPPPGNFPIDASGTCESLSKMGLHAICAPETFTMCAKPVFVCNKLERSCVCPSGDAGLAEGQTPFDGMIPVGDGSVIETSPGDSTPTGDGTAAETGCVGCDVIMSTDTGGPDAPPDVVDAGPPDTPAPSG